MIKGEYLYIFLAICGIPWIGVIIWELFIPEDPENELKLLRESLWSWENGLRRRVENTLVNGWNRQTMKEFRIHEDTVEQIRKEIAELEDEIKKKNMYFYGELT